MLAKFKIPNEYFIKMQSYPLTKIPVKTYGILDTIKTIKCVSNVEYIVVTTSQNIITVWKKSLTD
jgi:hypothetical protein